MRMAQNTLSLGLAMCLTLFGVVGSSPAQSEDDSSHLNYRTASQYYLETGMENKLMIRVNVWGAVQKPGSQYVPDGTDLISVLSAAGGPVEGAKLSEVRLVRNFDSQEHNVVINVSRCLKRGEVGLLPEIKPGDTVIVPKSNVSLGKFIGVVYHVAVIASVITLMTD
jgi:hypothetical protein